MHLNHRQNLTSDNLTTNHTVTRTCVCNLQLTSRNTALRAQSSNFLEDASVFSISYKVLFLLLTDVATANVFLNVGVATPKETALTEATS